MLQLDAKQIKTMKIVILYPFAILLVALIINFLFLELTVFEIELPNKFIVAVVAISAILFCINHSWLMTATELTRVRYKLYATPEEWEASNTSKQDASQEGLQEVERTHNAHNNSNENTVYFLLLLLPFIFSSPSNIAVLIWVLGFTLARLGYTFSYLFGKDNLRGLFMSLGLLAMYGVASYMFCSLIGLYVN